MVCNDDSSLRYMIREQYVRYSYGREIQEEVTNGDEP